MRILQIANKMPYPPKDGGSIATFSLGQAFRELGHEVTILAMNTSKHYYDLEKIPPDIRDEIKFMAVDLDTSIKPLQLFMNYFFSKIPYNAERFISKEFGSVLERLLQETTFDLIQLEGLYLAPYINTIRENSGALVAMRAHNVEHEIWERTLSQQKGLKKIYIKNLAKRIQNMDLRFLNDYDVLVPITKRDGKRFVEMGCKLPWKTIPTGIDTARFQAIQKDLEFLSVFHLGALDWMPNQEGLKWFIEQVWPDVYQHFPEAKFYIAGRNAPESISRINNPGIVFLGEVEDAYEFMAEKNVMVVPLLSGSGMRIKIIEGMALGKAIVSTSIGAEGIPVTSGRNIMIADTPGAFIQQISDLLHNKERCIDIGRNAKAFVKENFDNLAIAGSLLEFYEEQLT